MTSARDTWLIQLRAQKAASLVLTLFGSEGIDALPVKGIITSRTLYADVAERILTDVDIKVRPEDFRRLLKVIRREGFRELQRMYTYGNVVFAVDGVSVDVETHVSAPGLCALTVDALIKRSSASDLLGVPHLVPDRYDHAVVLILNVFKDKFVHAFKWAVRDLEILADRLDVVTLVARLEEAKVLSVGLVVAEWMMTEFPSTAWRSLRRMLADRAPRLHYARIHRVLLRHLHHDAMALRIFTRIGADSRMLRLEAVSRAAAWTAEAIASRFTDAPFVRQVLPDDVLVRQRP